MERVPAYEMNNLVAIIDGREPVPIRGTATLNTDVVGNVVFGGGVGLVVDTLSGRAVRYRNNVHVVFGE
jgi:hypothetical protein